MHKSGLTISRYYMLPEFLMMELQRSEFDRKAWTYCDSSVRGGLEWDRLCDMEIPDIDIDEQRKYVALYKGLLNNQKVYENSLADLQLICNAFLEDSINEKNLEEIGKHIELTDKRNSDGTITNILGVNINKEFMPSKVKVKSLLNYRVVEKGDFAANVMHVGRDEMLPVALYFSTEPAIVSPAYKTFRVKEESPLFSEFLMLWFYRSEFDRLTWYFCDSSVRGGLDWDRFCEIQIPILNKEKQEAIVTIYHTLETRKRINEQLKESIKPLCPVLMKGVVESLEMQTVES